MGRLLYLYPCMHFMQAKCNTLEKECAVLELLFPVYIQEIKDCRPHPLATSCMTWLAFGLHSCVVEIVRSIFKIYV